MKTPTAADLINHPTVGDALEAAWLDSQSGDRDKRHEEGGWIYINASSGVISVLRASRGDRSSIDLSRPPIVPDALVVGKFHTHPNPKAEGWLPGPSVADHEAAERDGVPSLIRAEDGIHTAGPDSRRGGLTGSPGYPAQ